MAKIKDNIDGLLRLGTLKKASAWILLIIGIGLMIVAYLFLQDPWRGLCLRIADILLIGVITGYLVNVARFMNAYKEALQDVIYAKTFLNKRNDLKTVWENISKLLFKEKFNAISGQLLDTVKNSYFPVEDPIYYNDMDITHIVEWSDKQKGLIKVTDILTFKLNTDTTKKVILPLRTWIDVKGLSKEDYSVRIEKFLVNGVQTKYEENCELKGDQFEHECKAEVYGQKKYSVEQVRTKVYSIYKDNYIAFRAKYIVNNLKVTLQYPDDFHVEFITRGTTKDYENATNVKGNIKSKKYNGIILPKQGYIFLLNFK